MTNRIYVGKLSPETTEQELYEYFAKAGKVVSAGTTKGINPKKNAGYGYVVMENEKETELIINKLNNTVLKGSKIKVMKAHFMDQDKPHYNNWKRFNR